MKISKLLYFSTLLVFISCDKDEPIEEIIANDGIEMRMAMQDDGYTEVVVNQIVKTDCYFSEWDKTVSTPVSGLFEYYDASGNWVASIDFGDGTCDQWATKTWDPNMFPDFPNSSEVFSVFDVKGKKGKK